MEFRKKYKLQITVYAKGFHLTGNVTPLIYGNITSYIRDVLYDKDAEKFLKDKGFKKVSINGVRTEWVHESRLTKENGYNEKRNIIYR